MNSALRSLSALLLVATAACSDATSPAAPELAPIGAAHSVILSGSSQQATAGADATDTLAVQFFAASGAPLAGAAVSWSTSAGSLVSATATTDANGIARTTVKADTKAGTAFVTAKAADTEASFVLFVNAGDPAAFEAMSGMADTLTLDAPFNGAPARVYDAFRNVVSGALVSVSVFDGDAEEASSTFTLTSDDEGTVRLPSSPASSAGRYRIVYTSGDVTLTYSLVLLENAPI